MKSLLFLLPALLFVIRISAQPFGYAVNGYRIIRMEYDNSDGENGTTMFKYNLQGNLEKAYWALHNGSRSSENFFQHDANGKIVSTNRKYSDGERSAELFEYDNQGNIIREYFFNSKGIRGQASYQYAGNRMMEAEMNKYKGWLNGNMIYYYNSKGVADSALLTRNGKTTCVVKYAYDERGNRTEEHWNFQGKWEQNFYCFYQSSIVLKNYYTLPWLCNNGEACIVAEEYSYNGTTGGPSVYQYDRNGLLASKEFIRSDGFRTKTSYQYDETRRLVSSERISAKGEKTVFTYQYNNENHLIARRSYMLDTLTGYELYQYNSEGELTWAILKNADGWLSGTVDFYYDAYGNLSKAHFSGEDGLKADLLFERNKSGLVTRTRWNFSDGKYQEYVYRYE